MIKLKQEFIDKLKEFPQDTFGCQSCEVLFSPITTDYKGWTAELVYNYMILPYTSGVTTEDIIDIRLIKTNDK